jgi:hypothetical protein
MTAFYTTSMKRYTNQGFCGGYVGVGGGMESERWIKRAIRHVSKLLK